MYINGDSFLKFQWISFNTNEMAGHSSNFISYVSAKDAKYEKNQ